MSTREEFEKETGQYIHPDDTDEYLVTFAQWFEQKLKNKETENLELRKLLWLRHGCSFHCLYGDDGEMQCHKCNIDFKRFGIEVIKKRLQE